MRAYVEVLSYGQARRLTLALIPVRIGYAMVALSVILLVQDRTTSLFVAGLTLGLFSLGAGALAPLRGYVVDRFGQTRPLLVYVPLFCASFALLTVAHQPAQFWALAAVSGAASPPLMASARPLWRDIVGEAHVRTAYALDSVAMQLTMISGAPLAAAIGVLVSPAAAVWTVSALVLVGGLLFLSVPASRTWRSAPRQPGMRPTRSLGVRTLMMAAIAMGAAFGALEVGLPALARDRGEIGGAGWLLAALALGSAVGGFWIGTQRDRFRPTGGVITSTALFALCLIPVAFGLSNAALLVALFVAGVAFGPAHVFLLELIDRVAPTGTAVSTFAWIVALESVGVTLGATVAGRLGDTHALAALAFAVVAATALPVLLHLRRRTLIAGQWGAAAAHVDPVPTETSSGTRSA